MKYTGVVLILLFISLLSCTKDDGGRIPHVFVDYRVFINDPVLKDFNSGKGFAIINGQGVAGILICRTPNGIKAFDRCSSVNPGQLCAVSPDDTGLTATDPCSGAKFSLYDGMPVKAPAKRPLKEYQVFASDFEIRVTNN